MRDEIVRVQIALMLSGPRPRLASERLTRTWDTEPSILEWALLITAYVMFHMGLTIPLWSCHYERSEESAFVCAEGPPSKQQIPHGLKAVRDDNSKSRIRTL